MLVWLDLHRSRNLINTHVDLEVCRFVLNKDHMTEFTD